jgi:transposase
VGIDTHSKFIQVCVLVNRPPDIDRHEREFGTSWSQLIAAKVWTAGVLAAEGFAFEGAEARYNIESTGTYHLPVIKAFGGRPSVVNPLLASPTRRKTDVLDARLLAYHALTSLWPASYLPTEEIVTLRVLLCMRADAQRELTRTGNQINNFLLRYGHTYGAGTRMTGSCARAVTEDLIAGAVPDVGGVCPTGIPPEARDIFRSLYDRADRAAADLKRWHREALDHCARRCEFVLGTGQVVSGATLMELLATVPGFGEVSRLQWAAEVCTPNRFPNAKAMCAYAGLDPSLKVSAGKVTEHLRRKGNARLHGALTTAVQQLLLNPREPFGEWARMIWRSRKKGGFKIACAALARRCLTASYHVTRTGTPFRYDGYTFCDAVRYDDASIEAEIPARFRPVLAEYPTAAALAEAMASGRVAKVKGAGEKCLETARNILRRHEIRKQSSKTACSSEGRSEDAAGARSETRDGAQP